MGSWRLKGNYKRKRRTVVIKKAKRTGDEFTYPTICGQKAGQKQGPLVCRIDVFQKMESKAPDGTINQKSSWHARKKTKRWWE